MKKIFFLTLIDKTKYTDEKNSTTIIVIAGLHQCILAGNSY